MNLIEITDEKDYKPLDLFEFTQFTQSWFYGQWHEFLGRNVRRFKLEDSGEAVSNFQVIPHQLPLGKKYLYIPFGPVFAKKPSQRALKAISEGLKTEYKQENIVFARTDPDGDFSELSLANSGWQKAPGFIKKEASFRPRGEMIVELTDEDTVFAKFDKNTRYSVRYGGKRGVETRIRTDLLDCLNDFYRLLEFTAKLQDFAIFEKDYYQNMLEVCQSLKNAYFIEATKDDHVISSKLIITYGSAAHSLLSGTDEEGRKLRVPSLVQWESIREAINRGLKRYSIGGASSSENDYPSIKAVTKYKQGFGGEVRVHPDLTDVVFNKPFYSAYNLYKKLR